jgi:cephalosporin hydroxylase
MSKFIEEFHKHLYNSRVWQDNTTWLGTPILKMPLDLFIYQEIIYEVKPDLIIETGTYNGGSALYFASILDLLNKGHVLTIDIQHRPNMPTHPRISYHRGLSTAKETIAKVKRVVKPNDVVMVILDSDHSKKNVLEELNLYKSFVTKDSYLVVEDTNINGHPVRSGWGEGPMEAVQDFLKGNKEFVIDKSKHKFFVTFHPNGFLKRL